MAQSLIRYQPGELFSSPEPKARETAEIVSVELHRSIHIIEELREHERSKITYISKSEFSKAILEFFEKPDILVFGSETANRAYERFSNAVNSILAEYQDDATAIVSHGTVMSLFVSRLIGRPAFEVWSGLGLPGFIVLDLQSNSLVAFENIRSIISITKVDLEVNL